MISDVENQGVLSGDFSSTTLDDNKFFKYSVTKHSLTN